MCRLGRCGFVGKHVANVISHERCCVLRQGSDVVPAMLDLMLSEANCTLDGNSR
jgi:hypothetical protein